MTIQDIIVHIENFLKYVDQNKIELYNEISLQHELGIYLRDKIGKSYSIQFERNISFFGYDNNTLLSKNMKYGWVKKEIDIVIYNDTEKFAIELKFPRNRAYQKRMFQFINDICFIEQLKDAGFNGGCTFVLVDDSNFTTFAKKIK